MRSVGLQESFCDKTYGFPQEIFGDIQPIASSSLTLFELMALTTTCPESAHIPMWILRHVLRIFAMQHRFTLLKFERYTFIAERQQEKSPLKKTLPLPQTKNPETFEREVAAALAAAFPLDP